MHSHLQDVLSRLSSRIEEDWNKTDCDYAAFPEIAISALRDLESLEPFTDPSLRQWLLSATDLPKQIDPQQRFGDPPITLFHSGKFAIDVYCWLKPALAVHDHAFCGAFAVVSGSTVQITYRFTETERISEALRIGNLDPVSLEALPSGSITPIAPGREFIHTTWHLARPTLSLCVRTVGPPDDTPQALYFPPHFRVDINPQALTGRYQSYMAFEKEAHGDGALDAFTLSLLEKGDLLLAFECLKKYASLTEDWCKVERMLGHVPLQSSSTRAALSQTVRHLHKGFWHYNLDAARGEGERLLLGLLTTFSAREPILEAVRKIHPGRDAVDLILEWIQSASDARVLSAQITPSNAILLRLALKKFAVGTDPGDNAPREVDSGASQMLGHLIQKLRTIESLQPLFTAAPK